MKIIHILPELQIGGVERFVIDLANEQTARGHDVMVISMGGQMESQLNSGVKVLHLPVHMKNPLTALRCAKKIAALVKQGNWQILHAHSRVPAWIAMLAAQKSGVPYIVHGHCTFNTKTHWIYRPYRSASAVICVSEAVRTAMKDCFYDNTTVVTNGLKQPKLHWNEDNLHKNRLLFVGRLSSVKGLQDVLNVLPCDLPWTLDVVGDGSQREEWQEICAKRGIDSRVTFHGYSDKVEQFMAEASCLLFPSYSEGMPLTLAQAVLVGIPVIASDIQPVAELKGDEEGLLPPGNADAWSAAINAYLRCGILPTKISPARVPLFENMVEQINAVYSSCLRIRQNAQPNL